MPSMRTRNGFSDLTSHLVMVSRETGRQTLRTQWFGDFGTPPSRLFDWRGGPNLGTPGRQTLYMYWFPLFVPYDHASATTSRAAKRYICASSAFRYPAPLRGSSIWTLLGPPNVTYVMISAFSQTNHETLHTHWFLRI